MKMNNSSKIKTTFEIWTQLIVSDQDVENIQKFFTEELSIKKKFLRKSYHLTVYHSRRPMPGVNPVIQNIQLILPVHETRFMVLAPGGENLRPDLIPGEKKVGIRVHKQCSIAEDILAFRKSLMKFETPSVLGRRNPSTIRKNAFGSRNFQPHLELLRAGSGINSDLGTIGELFREKIKELTFDKFIIDVVPAKKVRVR